MKIIINDNIIDTQNIYQITPVVGDSVWGVEEEKRPNKDLFYSGYYFYILMYNNPRMKVCLDCDDLFGENWRVKWKDNYPLYLERLEQAKTIINKIRDDIFQIWSNNQSTLPNFNLRDYYG